MRRKRFKRYGKRRSYKKKKGYKRLSGYYMSRGGIRL